MDPALGLNHKDEARKQRLEYGRVLMKQAQERSEAAKSFVAPAEPTVDDNPFLKSHAVRNTKIVNHVYQQNKRASQERYSKELALGIEQRDQREYILDYADPRDALSKMMEEDAKRGSDDGSKFREIQRQNLARINTGTVMEYQRREALHANSAAWNEFEQSEVAAYKEREAESGTAASAERQAELAQAVAFNHDRQPAQTEAYPSFMKHTGAQPSFTHQEMDNFKRQRAQAYRDALDKQVKDNEEARANQGFYRAYPSGVPQHFEDILVRNHIMRTGFEPVVQESPVAPQPHQEVPKIELAAVQAEPLGEYYSNGTSGRHAGKDTKSSMAHGSLEVSPDAEQGGSSVHQGTYYANGTNGEHTGKTGHSSVLIQ